MRYGGRIIVSPESVWCCAEQTWEWFHGTVDTRTANARRRLAFAWPLSTTFLPSTVAYSRSIDWVRCVRQPLVSIHDNEHGTPDRMLPSRVLSTSLGSHYRRLRSAGRPHSGGQPADQLSCRVHARYSSERPTQPTTLYRSKSSLWRSSLIGRFAGDSAVKPVFARRRCYPRQHVQIGGVAALKRAATPARCTSNTGPKSGRM